MNRSEQLAKLAEASDWAWNSDAFNLQLDGFEWVRFFAELGSDGQLHVGAVDPSTISLRLWVEADSLDEGLEAVLAKMEAIEGKTSCDYKKLVAEVRAARREGWGGED